jgi:UDP-N-acetylmuramyl pentapeptide phosphotransferase/UDP-N-acetylglucosamine-1-phosphate transferase
VSWRIALVRVSVPNAQAAMHLLAIALVISFLGTLVIIRRSLAKPSRTADHDFSGPQKVHTRPVPRVGGLAIIVAIATAAGIGLYGGHPAAPFLSLLLACSLPAFLAGFVEDLTKRVSPTQRLIATVVSALLGAWLLDAVITRTAIIGLDFLVQFTLIAVLVTAFVIAGVANAINIIDGFNGLASMCVVMMLAGIAYVAFEVGDRLVLVAAVVAIGAVLGFFAWNFPGGHIFLGDGGAYFLGYIVATLGVLLLRHDEVSPLFPLLLCGYPITETLFSIYRRKLVRGMSPGQPDGLHLHTLFFKRVMRLPWRGTGERRKAVRNSMTSPYLWGMCGLAVVPAVVWWNSTTALAWVILGYVCLYAYIYRLIVTFRTPRWLVVVGRGLSVGARSGAHLRG